MSCAAIGGQLGLGSGTLARREVGSLELVVW